MSVPSIASDTAAVAPVSSRPLVIAAVMASLAMVSVESTIVSTATPQIVAQLGDMHLFSWVFSAFLLAQTATTVIFGRLADLMGRKPVMLIAIAAFLAGSILVGFAWSMPSMIAFRLVQGIGAGAVQPVAQTIVGDLYSVQERGRIQGWLAGVWAASAVLGPLIGSFIIHTFSWAWIFWINVPVGIVAAGLFIRFLHEPRIKRQGRLDVPGGLLFTVAITSLMLSLSAMGTGHASMAGAAAVGCLISGVLFVKQERRTPDPMIDFALWGRRPIAAVNASGLIAAMALMGLTTFLPMYVQGVLGRSPVVAGLALTVMLIGWPAGSIIAARSFLRIGLRPLLRWGSLLLPVGAIAFIVLSPTSSPLLAAGGSLVMGLGMGMLAVSSMVLVQTIVQRNQRGEATASVIFSRNLGSTLGATLLGAVLNYGLAHFSAGGGAVDGARLQRLFDRTSDRVTGDAASIAGDVATRLALHHALHLTFIAMFALSVVIALVALLIPHVTITGKPEISAAPSH